MSAASRILVPCLLAAAAAGAWFLVPEAPRDEALARAASWIRGESGVDGTFWCPMDPEIVRQGQGMCPICSMELVPFEGAPTNASVLVLSDRQVQQAGVRVEPVAARRLVRTIDATGRLEVDPTQRRTITMKFPGKSRVERLQVHSVGDSVREGAVLFEVTNPTLVQYIRTFQEELARFPVVREEEDDAKTEAALERVNAARSRLTRHGLPAAFVANLASKPKYLYTEPVFPVIAEEPGTVLETPSLEIGATLVAGAPLYVTGDLGTLWLYLDLFEDDLPFVAPGQVVEFTTRAVPDQVFKTKIRLVEPMVRAPAQTIRARARVGSLDGKLMPGMLVRATIASDLGEVLAVGESAVLQSGRRDVVIVAEGDGHFRPRLVKLGRKHLSAAVAAGPTGAEGFAAGQERYHEVLSGLAPGDRVVVAGNFLLNAEAQFQGILKKMYAADEAQQAAPTLQAKTVKGLEQVIDEYTRTSDALVADDLAAVRMGSGMLLQRARGLARSEPDLAPMLERIAAAAEALARATSTEEPDWVVARSRFGDLSRELVEYVGTYAPARVTGGELHLFRCPMADEFGYDLWLQRTPDLQNPYMGQSMPQCGMSAELP